MGINVPKKGEKMAVLKGEVMIGAIKQDRGRVKRQEEKNENPKIPNRKKRIHHTH